MLNLFKSEIEHESKTVPGARLTVRSLNFIDKAAREASLLQTRARMKELGEEELSISDLKETVDPETKKSASRRVPKPGHEERFAALNEEWAMLLQRDVMPAVIRAGFVRLDIEGESITSPEALLRAGNEANALISEVYWRCNEATEFTEEQRKNLSSPSTSSTAAPEGETPSIAQTAA